MERPKLMQRDKFSRILKDKCPGGGGNFNRRMTGVCHLMSAIAP